MLGSEIHNLIKIKLEEYSPYNPSTDGPLLQGGDLYDEVKPIGAYIKAHLAEAANEALLMTPTSKLYAKKGTFSAIEDDDDPFIGKVYVPYDYLKIHTFKMSCWKKPVHICYKEGDYMDSRQIYVATRGNCWKPVVIEHGIADFGIETFDAPSSANTIASAVDYLQSTIYDRIGTCTNKTILLNFKDAVYRFNVDSKQQTIMGETEKIVDIISTPEKINYAWLNYYSTDGSHDIETFQYVPVFSESNEYLDRVAEFIALNCAKKVCEVFERTDALAIINNEMQSVLQALVS